MLHTKGFHIEEIRDVQNDLKSPVTGCKIDIELDGVIYTFSFYDDGELQVVAFLPDDPTNQIIYASSPSDPALLQRLRGILYGRHAPAMVKERLKRQE